MDEVGKIRGVEGAKNKTTKKMGLMEADLRRRMGEWQKRTAATIPAREQNIFPNVDVEENGEEWHNETDDDEPLRLAMIQKEVKKVMEASYATTTMANRKSAQGLLRKFAQHQKLRINPDTIMKWVASQRHLKWTTKRGYFFHAMAILNPKEKTDVFKRGLAKLAASERTKKAVILTQEEVIQIMRHLPQREKVAFYVGIRTGCRINEIIALTPAIFTGASKHSIYMHWGHHTKGTQMDPNRPDTYVELRQSNQNSEYQYPLTLHHVESTLRHVAQTEGANAPISKMDYRQWLDALKKGNPDATGHSIKRTAVTRAVEVVGRLDLDPRLIGRLAKHKAQFDDVAAVTLQYAGRPVEAARVLKTGSLTMWL